MAAKPKPITTAIIDRPDAAPPEFILDAIDALPDEITNVIVVDYGVAHPSPAIVEQMESMLEHRLSCQPFSRITYLDKDRKPLGAMSSAAKGYSVNDRRWHDHRHYCQRGIIGYSRQTAGKDGIGMIPGEITGPVPTPYVPPVIEPAVFVELPPVYAIQDPSELYTDPIRILPEELAHKDREDNIGMLLAFGAVSVNLDTPPKP